MPYALLLLLLSCNIEDNHTVKYGFIVEVNHLYKTLKIAPDSDVNEFHMELPRTTIIMKHTGKGIVNEKGKKLTFLQIQESIKHHRTLAIDVYVTDTINDYAVTSDHAIVYGDIIPNP